MPATRTTHEKVSDFLWGAPDPSPADRKHLELIRASAREAGRQVEDIAMRELEAKGVGSRDDGSALPRLPRGSPLGRPVPPGKCGRLRLVRRTDQGRAEAPIFPLVCARGPWREP